MSLVRRLEIGRGWNAVQVAVVTYRGSSVLLWPDNVILAEGCYNLSRYIVNDESLPPAMQRRNSFAAICPHARLYVCNR